MKYFTGSFVVTIIGLILSFFVGHYYGGTVAAGLEALFIASVLAVLETSLSFDNAIVNATVLKDMTHLLIQQNFSMVQKSLLPTNKTF
jgi:hypothetical protein